MREMDRKQRQDAKLLALTTKLNLTTEQQAAIRAALEKGSADRDALREAGEVRRRSGTRDTEEVRREDRTKYAEAEATQTPVEMPAMFGLATLATVAGGRVEVEPRPGWREGVNLFVGVVMESGSRKSAVHRDCTAPVVTYERELVEEATPTVAEKASQRRRAEQQLASAEKAAANAQAKDRVEHEGVANELARELVRLADVDDADGPAHLGDSGRRDIAVPGAGGRGAPEEGGSRIEHATRGCIGGATGGATTFRGSGPARETP
jgi:hypothetical protein